MAISALHPWVKARPSSLTGAFKKAFRAFLWSISTPNTSRNTFTIHTNDTRDLFHGNIAPRQTHNFTNKISDLTLKDAITKEKFPEASPKEPALEHFRALAGQRIKRTLGI